MQPHEAADPKLLGHYEGLIRKTAALYVGVVEEDYDDLCQIFRIKTWKALLAFDPARSRTGRDRWVFSCIKNQAKDLLPPKRAQRNWLYIEDIAPVNSGGTGNFGKGIIDEPMGNQDGFYARYLGVTAEEVFGGIEEGATLVPSTLTPTERNVVALLYIGCDYGEISTRLDLERKKVATVVRRIREKMEDWRPNSSPSEAAIPVAA